jgi:succinate dehydrogenase flavin-adding protein (antitoxin of CptAB toxin-antitoxin module)
MREIDLLLREFSQKKLGSMKHEDIKIFDAILDHDDQKLFDYIFKGEAIGIEAHEIFIDTHLKNFTHQGNF